MKVRIEPRHIGVEWCHGLMMSVSSAYCCCCCCSCSCCCSCRWRWWRIVSRLERVGASVAVIMGGTVAVVFEVEQMSGKLTLNRVLNAV